MIYYTTKWLFSKGDIVEMEKDPMDRTNMLTMNNPMDLYRNQYFDDLEKAKEHAKKLIMVEKQVLLDRMTLLDGLELKVQSKTRNRPHYEA